MKQMAEMCAESFMIPIIVMFFNETATSDILSCKLSEKINQASLLEQMNNLKRLPWYRFGTRFIESCKLNWAKVRLRLSVFKYQPDSDKCERCLQEPEFQFLKYLYALTERIRHWNSFSKKHLPIEQLPQEFRNVLGLSDPPHAEYSHLTQLKEFADAYMTPSIQQTLFLVLLAEKMNVVHHLEPPHRA